jgi:hypothetical protein
MRTLQFVSRNGKAWASAAARLMLAARATAVVIPFTACGASDGSGSPGGGGHAGTLSGGAGGLDAARETGSGGRGGTGMMPLGGNANVAAGSGGSVPTGSDASASGTADTSTRGAADARAETGCAKSQVTPSELVFLGDSYLAWPTSTILPHIEEHLQMESSSAYSAMPRRYDVSGANMMQIVDQYAMAHSQDPRIDTIIMDGGGNDVLLSDRSCLTEAPPANQTCVNTVNATVMLAGQALSRMQMDGVKHVVFFFYPHVQTVGLSGPAANDTLDYAYPLARRMCESIPICVFVDTRPPWEGHQNDYIDPFFGLNVHPNEQGSRAIVDGALWPAMVAACVLQ